MRNLTIEQKSALADKMITELPVLRARLGLSQEELGEKIGLSRQMVVAMETRNRPMTWNTYLSLILLFLHNPSTAELLRVFGVYTDELREFLDVDTAGRSGNRLAQ